MYEYIKNIQATIYSYIMFDHFWKFIYLPTLNFSDVTIVYTNTQIPLLLMTTKSKVLIFNIYVFKRYIITEISMKMFMFKNQYRNYTIYNSHNIPHLNHSSTSMNKYKLSGW